MLNLLPKILQQYRVAWGQEWFQRRLRCHAYGDLCLKTQSEVDLCWFKDPSSCPEVRSCSARPSQDSCCRPRVPSVGCVGSDIICPLRSPDGFSPCSISGAERTGGICHGCERRDGCIPKSAMCTQPAAYAHAQHVVHKAAAQNCHQKLI